MRAVLPLFLRAPAAVLLLLVTGTLGAAQDALTVNPGIVSVAFEDARVRVLRIRCGPHEKLAVHSHPSVATVSITASNVRVTQSNGAVSQSRHASGDVYWSEPATHTVENLSDQPTELIQIEFKNAPQPAVNSGPHKSSGKLPAGAPLPVEDEPHHHLVYQNQYLRMLEVRLPPGETTEFHTHSHDNLAVRLSEAMVTRQDQGQEWVPVTKVVPGEVSLTKGAASPYTHRVRNAGSTPFRVIDVELLQ